MAFINSDTNNNHAPFILSVADDGTIHGLEDGYSTFSKRGERGDRDLWAQHLSNLLGRLGAAAASLAEWEFLSVNGDDVIRINVEPSDFPVYDIKSEKRIFWRRTQVGTEAVLDKTELDKLIARRWGS